MLEVRQGEKLVAAICHGGWIPISAGVYRGIRVTGSPGIKDDLVNAGAEWVDAPTVTDGNIVSARVPKDLPAFGAAMIGPRPRATRTTSRARRRVGPRRVVGAAP